MRHGRRLLVVAVAVPLLAACGSDADPDDEASRLLFSPTGTAGPVEATPTGTPAPTLPPFPESCSDVVPANEVVAVVGRPLPGEASFVRADALPDIGRTARVTCGYGVGEGDDPLLEITVNEYGDEASADERIQVTLDASAQSGRTVEDNPVGPYPGWLLAGAGSGPTLVVDAGTRTVVVSLQPDVVPEQAAPVVLTQLAERALGLPTAAVE